jgi:hypothetical protein
VAEEKEMSDEMSGKIERRKPDLVKDRQFLPSVPDVLQNYRGKPLVTVASPSVKYIGRLIIELYEHPSGSDANNLAMTFDLAPGESQSDLVGRIAAALPERLKTIPPRS